MLVELGVAIPAAAAAALGYGIRGRSSRMFGPSAWRGPRDAKRIALTFDDGPSEATLELLDVLDVFNARATFFQCGSNVARLPEFCRRVRERGHEIGNHSYSHPRLLGCPSARIRQEIHDTQAAIREAAGVEPKLFRAPYGLRWFGLGAALREHHLLGVMWTVIGYDWEWEASEIAAYVVAHATPGGIVCLHDGDRVSPQVDRRNTVSAVRSILPRLHEQGFTFVTAGEMLGV